MTPFWKNLAICDPLCIPISQTEWFSLGGVKIKYNWDQEDSKCIKKNIENRNFLTAKNVYLGVTG